MAEESLTNDETTTTTVEEPSGNIEIITTKHNYVCK